MCFSGFPSSIKSTIEWLKELNKAYKIIYDNTYIIDNSYYNSNNRHVIRAKQAGLSQLEFNDTEIEKFTEFIKKIAKICKKYYSKTGRSICVNPHFFVHHCFPEKNIIPDYYKIMSSYKIDNYKNVWDNIKNIFEEEEREIARRKQHIICKILEKSDQSDHIILGLVWKTFGHYWYVPEKCVKRNNP